MRIFSANEAAQRFYGYTLEEFEGMKITSLNCKSDEDMKHTITQVLEHKLDLYCFKHRLANGEIRDVEIHAAPIPFINKQMIFSIVHDITERKKAEEYITYLAYHDSLTGLPNRKYFYERLAEEFEKAAQNHEMFAILYIDLDGFKKINDTYSHEVGDFLLCEIGTRMKGCIREGDTLARIGGDEFTLLVLDICNLNDAQMVAQRICECLQTPVIKDGKELKVSASIGISIFPDDGDNLDSLLYNADKKMYIMKNGSL